jgi:hypothetical protein
MDHEVETIIAWRSLLSLQLPTLVIGGAFIHLGVLGLAKTLSAYRYEALVIGGAFVHLGVLGLAKNSGSCMQSVTIITNRNSADSIDKVVGMIYDHLL